MRRRQSNQEHKLPKSKSIKTQLYTEREASPTATCSLHQQWRICHSSFEPNYRSCISVAAGNPRRPAPISGGNRNAYTVGLSPQTKFPIEDEGRLVYFGPSRKTHIEFDENKVKIEVGGKEYHGELMSERTMTIS